MAVKAKNTITLVRTDDGLPAYVHPAWANSPDGTVDFTTVYPGENLMSGTLPNNWPTLEGKRVTGSAVATLGDEKVLVTADSSTPYYFVGEFSTGQVLSDEFIAKIKGKRLVASADVAFVNQLTVPTNNLGISIYCWSEGGNYINPNRRKSIAGNERIWIDALIPEDAVNVLVAVRGFGRFVSGESFEFDKLKLEIVDEVPEISPIYTPSPQDDPIGAYPKYMGTCSNHSETAPTDPSAYHWEVDPTYLEYSKVGGDQYDSDQSEIYEVIGGKADSEEFQALKREADALLESYNSFVSEGGKYEQDLKNIENRAIGLIEQLNDKIAQFEFIKTYIRMGEEGLEIGAQDSAMKMLLTRDSLSFMDGGKVVAYFTKRSFYINRGAIVESLQIGNHKFTKLNEQVTVIQYVG